MYRVSDRVLSTCGDFTALHAEPDPGGGRSFLQLHFKISSVFLEAKTSSLLVEAESRVCANRLWQL